MKNKKTPSILKFVMAISFMLIGAFAFSLAFTAGECNETQSFAPMFKGAGVAFLALYAIQLFFGPIISRYTPKGALRNDSLVINDTTYAGTFAPYFILPALFDMDTFQKGLLYLKDGIKKQHTIGKLDFSSPLQPRVANPTQSGGDITVSGNVITPQDVMVYQEFNPRDFESHWVAEDLSPTLLTRQLPPTVESYISMLIVGRAFEQYEIGTWMGSTNYQNNPAVPSSDARYQLQFFNGFMQRFVNDAGVVQVGSPVALTSSNIGDKLAALYQLVATNNKALIAKATRYQRMKFIVSINTALIYEEFQVSQPYKNINTTEKGILMYKGYEIVPVAGMPDNTIVFTEAIAATDGNLWMGMNSIQDENFQLARVNTFNELFGFKMLMKMDVQYGFANKVFLYTTLVAGDFIAS